MLEPLANFILSTPYVVFLLSLGLAATVCLSFAHFRSRYLLFRFQKSIASLQYQLKDTMDSQLARENQLEAKIARMKRQLEHHETQFTENELMVDQLRMEFSASIQATQGRAVIFLRDFKKELLRGVSVIEAIEAENGIVEIRETRPSRPDSTLSFLADKKQPEIRTLPASMDDGERITRSG